MKKDWEPMSSMAAEGLFHKEAVMYGAEDGIPWTRAEELVGIEALAYANDMAKKGKGNIAWNVWSTPRMAKYCTRYGWNMAVTFNNVMAVGE